MDIAHDGGFVVDPAKCCGLNLEEKRELFHEISLWAENALQILQSWSCQELLEIISEEKGKERKYTGLAQPRMIDLMLKLVLQKKDDTLDASLVPQENDNETKGKRKKEQSLQLATEFDPVTSNNNDNKCSSTLLCQNFACQATLSPEDAFCKRCSCSICYSYDDNKDPSLWLVCNSDPPYQGDSCGTSCHLKCVLEHERAGIVKNGCHGKLDGSFYCVCCRKLNGLIGSWRKQLLIAKDARRVDALCHRISLSHKILKGTEQYKVLQMIVDMAAKKLEEEIGPLDNVSEEMAQGIVDQLACSPEIQKLCAIAVQAVDTMLSGIQEPVLDADAEAPIPPTCHIKRLSFLGCCFIGV